MLIHSVFPIFWNKKEMTRNINDNNVQKNKNISTKKDFIRIIYKIRGYNIIVLYFMLIFKKYGGKSKVISYILYSGILENLCCYEGGFI